MKNISVILLSAVCFVACGGPDKKSEATASAEKRPAVSQNSSAFNQSFQKLLASYYSLKDAITDEDTVKANSASRELGRQADQLQTADIKNDSTGAIKETAKNYTGTITGSAVALAGETDIQKKRKEFQMISDALYDLARTVKFDGQTIYHQHCPMAFNNEEEAYWLSNRSTIVNPYLGRKHPKYKDKMVGCGDVTDSLGYMK